jgi:hypothetical protein
LSQGGVWRRALKLPIRLAAADDRELAGVVRSLTWAERPGGAGEARCELEVSLAGFQQAWDAGWLGLGPGSPEPGSEWSFSGALPLALTLVLQAPSLAALPQAEGSARLDQLAAALSGEQAAPALLEVAAWRYRTVLQEQSPGVKAGFGARQG